MSFHEEHDPLDECVVEVLKERIKELKARIAELEAAQCIWDTGKPETHGYYVVACKEWSSIEYGVAYYTGNVWRFPTEPIVMEDVLAYVKNIPDYREPKP